MEVKVTDKDQLRWLFNNPDYGDAWIEEFKDCGHVLLCLYPVEWEIEHATKGDRDTAPTGPRAYTKKVKDAYTDVELPDIFKGLYDPTDFTELIIEIEEL